MMTSTTDAINNGITNGISADITITPTADFHKKQKCLTDKQQYIKHAVLIIALIAILFGIFLIFGRHNRNVAPKISQLDEIENVGNRSGKLSSNQSELPTEHTKLPKYENSEFASMSSSFNESQCVTLNDTRKCLHINRKNLQNDANIPSEDFVAHLGHFMGWRPKHYELNMTINRDPRTSFMGNVNIYIKAIESTSSVSLHVGRSISDIALSQISAHNCRTGEAYCVASIVYHQKDEVLSIEFSEPISVGHVIVLQIKNFTSFQASVGLIVKSPQKWEPKRPWTVTTFFQLRNARSVFPCFDLPIMKASMKMCINHPARTEARSNTKMRYISKNNNRMETCFEHTPPMSTYLYAFTIFDRMNSMKEGLKSQEYLPEIEVLYSEEDNFIKPDWISTEAIHALKMMANISDFRYPLNKLNLMATFLPVYGLENLGLIMLDERFVAYPKYRLAHTILAHEIAQQWIGSIVTIKNWKEMCLQEGLTTYLEWIITKALDNSTEMDELIVEKRREGILKDTTTSTTIISEFHSSEDISRCFDKPAMFFVMLELGFGEGTVAKVIKLLMKRYAYANAGFQEWRRIIVEAGDNVLAGEFFEKYFTQSGLPLIHVSPIANALRLTQNVTVMKQVIDAPPFTVPLDVAVIEKPERTVIILRNETEMIPLQHNGLLVLDPDGRTHAIIVYEPEVYLRFVQCTESSSCSTFLKPETIKRISDDFCWAFLANYFSISEKMHHQARIWMQFMEILARTSYVPGSCACCMDKNLEKSGTYTKYSHCGISKA
uniref:Aminopeptidase n=1 Tax=Setaria digitata TaxID=48799 RepID=A0A915PFQ4_9BILA